MKKYIVGLHGKRRAGKDSAADYLVRAHGFTKLAFADSLREDCSMQWGVELYTFTNDQTKDAPDSYLSAALSKDKGFCDYLRIYKGYTSQDLVAPRTPRWVLQTWSDYRKTQYGNMHYLTKLGERLTKIQGPVVISDVRYEMEAEFITALTCCIGIIEIARSASDSTCNHASDKPLPKRYINATVVNDGTLEQLGNYLSNVMLPALKIEHRIRLSMISENISNQLSE